MDKTFRQKIDKKTWGVNNTIDKMNLTDTERSAQQQQNTHSSQVHMELSPE